jgi:hypothetical protein
VTNGANGPPSFARPESETGFTAILGRLLRATPGAVGAALVDAEGEAVDYAGDKIDPFDLKIAAATWRIVLSELEIGKLAEISGPTHRLSIHAAQRTFVIDALPDGYALLSVLLSDASEGHATRALHAALRDLYREAGWPAPPSLFRWFSVEVRSGAGERPLGIRASEHWAPLAVIGRVAGGLLAGEIGWRVALIPSHVELTLVRGRDDRWWMDLEPESLFATGDDPM